ncbi:MAG: DUF262 domain-containing protein [Candidatus Latescibacteria bacterium]|nr:DUF262 domain-containing protein [Candidatus Latescibacterota bacterium]
METLTIREIINQVDRGQIRIPAFQRSFVWEPDRVAFLIDSIFKSYPYGALLFWRTDETLSAERQLGPFQLPEPKADYPIDYVLDGQQRITSIYATFQTGHDVEEGENWKDIYFDFTTSDDAQETQFYALLRSEADPTKYFPLRVLFDTTAYRRATNEFDDGLANRIDEMQSVFKEARIPVQMFRTDEKGTVAVIFERINRQGVPLDTMQLLAAWTWSEEFQLQNEFEDLTDDLDNFGYNTGNVDENLLLRCASAVLVNDPKPEAIVEIPGEHIRNRFDEVVNGVKGGLDFLRANFGIQRIDNLPFQTILVPFSVFFAVSGTRQIVVDDDQRNLLIRWFWRTCFSRRYSSGVLRNLREDIQEMLQLKGGQKSNLGNFSVGLETSFFLTNNFTMRNVNAKTLILLLAQQGPKSFISGGNLDLTAKLKEYNKTEFHHIMPKSYVSTLTGLEYSVNCLANLCFLSRSENKTLGGCAPSIYRSKMSEEESEILGSALCPQNLFEDLFDPFVKERARLLTKTALKLIDEPS